MPVGNSLDLIVQRRPFTLRGTLSIALIALILFNSMGYYGFMLGLQYHNGRKLIEALDAEYENLSGAISIKIPITIPYATDSWEYERVDGIFEHKNEFFRLVKRRLYRDTLEIICIRDVQHKQINQAFVKHASSMTDKTDSTPGPKAIQLVKEYMATTTSISRAAEGWRMHISASQLEVVLHSGYSSLIIQPPERS
jgi:hypothetical protein